MKVNLIEDANITGLSLVEKPANGSLICNELEGCSIDGNTIDVVVLKSNDKIYRKPTENQDERFIYWNKESLERTAHNTYGKDIKTTLNHNGIDREDISILESYVDSGSWKMKLQVSNEIKDQIKDGKLKGVSIEGTSKERTIIDITKNLDKLYTDAKQLETQTRKDIFLD